MKKFKKKRKKNDMDDISSLYYWGAKTRLIAASWDTNVRSYDDNTSEQEGMK